MLEELEKIKLVVCEPRGNESLDKTMQEFYACIDTVNQDDRNALTGAMFMAVCRGKVSEGLDFADNNARAIISVSITILIKRMFCAVLLF